MILCVDVGNTHIFGGIFTGGKLQFQFRYPSTSPSTSDQLGIFFKTVLRENEIEVKQISRVAICSVVPSLNYTIRSAFLKYVGLEPFFLHVNNVGRLKINYNNPAEVGLDRISNAIAATHKYPNQDLIVIDMGTATTFDAITADNTYLGGVIMPGLYISMKALYENTAKLSPVNIIKPQTVIGQSTTTNIQSGLYYGHLGAAKEVIQRITQTAFNGRTPIVIGTGGFAYLFEHEGIFTSIVPDLILHGLFIAASAN